MNQRFVRVLLTGAAAAALTLGGAAFAQADELPELPDCPSSECVPAGVPDIPSDATPLIPGVPGN
jgi:hypothetical protein